VPHCVLAEPWAPFQSLTGEAWASRSSWNRSKPAFTAFRNHGRQASAVWKFPSLLFTRDIPFSRLSSLRLVAFRFAIFAFVMVLRRISWCIYYLAQYCHYHDPFLFGLLVE